MAEDKPQHSSDRPRRNDRGGRRSRQDRGPQEPPEFTETTVHINRCATVTKGGRTFSFSALVVVGDRKGRVGYGFGKAREVPMAIEKATKEARRNLVRIPLINNTLQHEVVGRFCASKVFMKPAAPGTGVIASAPVRAVMEALGVHDVLTKCYGSPNPINVVEAVMRGLKSMRTREEVAALRGVELE